MTTIFPCTIYALCDTVFLPGEQKILCGESYDCLTTPTYRLFCSQRCSQRDIDD